MSAVPICGPTVIPPIELCNLAAALLIAQETGQSVPQGAIGVPVNFTQEYQIAQGVTPSTAGDSITIAQDGIYLVGFGITFAPNGTVGQLAVAVSVNGGAPPSPVLSALVTSQAAAPTVIERAAFVQLNAGDVLQLEVANATDAAVEITSAALSAGGCV